MRHTASFPGIVASLVCLPVLGALVAGLLDLSFPAGMVPVILAACIGMALGYVLHARATPPTQESQPITPSVTPPAPITFATQPTVAEDPKLRHDIKGIISPAMLAIEQLETSTDPLVQKTAATINSSFERLLARLKQRTS